VNQVEKRSARGRLESDQHVHVAVRAKIVAQHGTEQGELGDPPPVAELRDALSI
jgi:hypothetical protein